MAASNRALALVNQARSSLSNLIAPREMKSAPFSWPSYSSGVVTWGMGNFMSYVNDGFNLNSLIYSAVMYKVRAAAQARLRAYTGDPDSPDALPLRHPLAQLMSRPNPYQSFAELHGLIIAYLNLAGNAYLYVDRDGAKGGVPMALYPLRPDRVYLIPGDGTIKGWMYRPPTMPLAEGVPILAADMIHIKFPNLMDQYEGMGYGLSPMSPLAQSADVDNNATKFIKLFFERGGMPVGILKYDIPLDFDQIREIKQKWREVYGGVGNWTDIGVVDSAASYEKLGQDFSKLGMDQMDARNETRILGPFGVPPILLNTKYGMERSTFSNYEEARKAFWQDTMSYELKLELDAFSHFLQGEDGSFVGWDLSDVPALKKDILALTNSAKALFDMGVPAKMAFDAVGLTVGDLPAGDMVFFPTGIKAWDPDQPFGAPPAPNPFLQVPPKPGDPAADPNADLAKPGKVPPKDPAATTEGQANAEDDTRKSGRQAGGKKDKGNTGSDDEEDHGVSLEKKQLWTKAADQTAESHEEAYKIAARWQFEEDARHIKALVGMAAKSARHLKATIDWEPVGKDIAAYLKGESSTRWRSAFVPLLSGTIKDAGKYWTTQLGTTFDLRNLLAEDWFQDYQLKFAKPISATTEAGVKDIISDAMAEVLSISEVQDQLGSLFTSYADYRTERIARTETIRAYNAGSNALFSDWGADSKEWSPAMDDRTRESHADAAGQVVGIDEMFSIGGYDMAYPGDAENGAPPSEFVNCRCSVLPAGDLEAIADQGDE